METPKYHSYAQRKRAINASAVLVYFSRSVHEDFAVDDKGATVTFKLTVITCPFEFAKTWTLKTANTTSYSEITNTAF